MVADRESAPPERQTAKENGPENQGKRKFIRGLMTLTFLSLFASVATIIKSLVPGKKMGGEYVPTVKDGDLLVYAEGDRRNQLMNAADLMVGDAMLAYPKGKEDNYANIIQVIREEVGSFREPTIIDWTDKGYVAYSAICTHLSCTVTWKKRSEVKASHIHCNCHDSVFDPLRGGIVLAGPAPEAVPQVPIRITSSGQIMIRGEFEGQVGPRV